MSEIRFRKVLNGFKIKYLEVVGAERVEVVAGLHQLEIFYQELEEILYLLYQNIQDIKDHTL